MGDSHAAFWDSHARQVVHADRFRPADGCGGNHSQAGAQSTMDDVKVIRNPVISLF